MIKDANKFMERALELASLGANIGEVPVGCVIVKDGQIISEAHNLVESKTSPCAHAEIIAINAAAKKLKTWRLEGLSLFVSLEPCAMCAGAILNSRISELYFAASDEKFGACGSFYDLINSSRRAKKIKVYQGLMANKSVEILQAFFKKLR